MVEVIVSEPVIKQHTCPAVGIFVSPSSSGQQDKVCRILSRVGSPSALKAFAVISISIEITIPYISMNCEMFLSFA